MGAVTIQLCIIVLFLEPMGVFLSSILASFVAETTPWILQLSSFGRALENAISNSFLGKVAIHPANNANGNSNSENEELKKLQDMIYRRELAGMYLAEDFAETTCFMLSLLIAYFSHLPDSKIDIAKDLLPRGVTVLLLEYA